MMRVLLFMLIVSVPLSVFAQDAIHQRGRYVPTKEEVEANERLSEILRNPTFIRLRLVFLNPNTDETTDLAPPYKSGDPITVRVILNHYFNGPITIVDFLNPYTSLRLELLRDGDVVPYKMEARQSVKKALTEPPNDGSKTTQVLPETDYALPQRINLSDWYKSLGLGRYQLTVKRRFVWGGEWVRSDSITFEIGNR